MNWHEVGVVHESINSFKIECVLLAQKTLLSSLPRSGAGIGASFGRLVFPLARVAKSRNSTGYRPVTSFSLHEVMQCHPFKVELLGVS